jgi:GT2 family glycosyltransferase
MSHRPQIVLLGMMTKIPVAGVIWQTLHYLVGLERLGYETYYVEAHARTPSMLMERADDDSSGRAAAFIAGVLERFGFGARWAYQALHADGRCYGLSEQELQTLFRSAVLIINLHGGTKPRPEHIATDRLVYLETDPVDVEIQLADGRQQTVDYLEPHCAFFTFGENYGNPDCLLPVSKRFRLNPTRQPVVLDFWQGRDVPAGDRYTTIGNWRQQWREIHFAGETYGWSKHEEFLKFLELPSRTGPLFELALAGCVGDDRKLLEQHGWCVRDAAPLSQNIDIYRHYICGSRGEFTVAKDQNVRLRTGWFSDRSATYLAAGRPVITQDTGFGNILPTGEGLFAFSTIDDIAAAMESILSDYDRHSRAAGQVALEYFDASRVLRRLLEEVGLPRIPPGLVISLQSRRPTTLPPASAQAVLDAPLPVAVIPASEQPEASVVVVTRDGLVFTRLCLESTLGSLESPTLELIVVDNGSTDGTLEYVDRLAKRDPRIRLISNGSNLGFAAAANQGLAIARGRRFVILNNDTILPPRSLGRLLTHVEDETLGLVGPVSNLAATEAEIDVSYTSYSELLNLADARAKNHSGDLIDLEMLTMFCVAFRRDVYESVGPLDERYEVGLFEDDDYSLRVKQAAYRIGCAEDVFVHHFGEASLGALVSTGEHAALFAANQRRFEEKWGIPWKQHGRLQTDEYRNTIDRIRETVIASVRAGARVLVVSKGDDELLQLEGCLGSHFPQVDGGVYAGYYPADSGGAIEQLEELRARGAEFLLFPGPAFWWFDFYGGFRDHLDSRYHRVCQSQDCVIYDLAAG